jgi:hypothetical protein
MRTHCATMKRVLDTYLAPPARYNIQLLIPTLVPALTTGTNSADSPYTAHEYP